MFYFYKDTVITVKPGIGGDNWATVKRKPNGNWTTLKAPAMPRVNRFDTAVNNLHAWAEKKGLEKADCGCCFYNNGEGECTKYSVKLKPICKDFHDIMAYERCKDCLINGFRG